MNTIEQPTQALNITSVTLDKNNEKCFACKEIKDDDKYTLAPTARLRNSQGYVIITRVSSGDTRIHKAVGIVLALCNGQRTVSEIARITRPFVRIDDDRQALEVSKHKVKDIIFSFRRTSQEIEGASHAPAHYPPDSVLLSKATYDKHFATSQFPQHNYNPTEFLPGDSEVKFEDVRQKRETIPSEIQWHFTPRCATDCKYCYLGRRNVKLLPKERTLALINEAAELGIPNINPLGGDILLYPHLFDVFNRMHELKFLPVLLSTKTFLSLERAKRLKDTHMVYDCQFSIDSTVDDVADYLVGRDGYCDSVLKSIANAMEVGMQVKAKAVVTGYNILTIPKLYRDLRAVGVPVIHLGIYMRSGYHHNDGLFVDETSYRWLEGQIQKLQEEFPEDDIRLQNGIPMPQSPSEELRQTYWERRANCAAGRSRMMICGDGKVIPCEQIPETDEYFCGDVTYQSLSDVWNSKRLIEQTCGMPHEKFKGQPCYECDEREQCLDYRGICIRELSKYLGNIYQPDMKCLKSALPYLRQT